MLEISLFQNRHDTIPVRQSFATFEELYEFMLSVARSGPKDGPLWSPATFISRREKQGVASVCCLVFDVDEPGALPQFQEQFKEYSYFYHSTFTKDCYRFVVATERPHLPAEHPSLWARAKGTLEVDEACKDSSRMFYLPTCSEEEEESECVFFLNKSDSVKPFPVSPMQVVKGSQELKDFIGCVWQDPGPGKRHAYMQALTLDYAAYPGATIEQGRLLLEKAAARIHNDHKPAERKVAWNNLLNGAFRIQEERAKSQVLSDLTELAVLSEKPRAFEASQGWEQKAHKKLVGGNEVFDRTGYNIKLILENDPEFKGLRFNVRTQEMECERGILHNLENMNIAGTLLANWMSTSRYNLRPNGPQCLDQLTAVLEERKFDPVREYLEGLVWDGQGRLDEFIKMCSPIGGNPRVHKMFGRKFLISAAARALKPGCQVDTMLILTGKGGVGKTSLVRILGGAHSTSLRYSVNNNNTLMQLRGSWLVEMAELTAMGRSDQEMFRGFVTETRDDYRPPYARATIKQPRSCVFIGTSNEGSPITDIDGIRRFWPVEVGQIDLTWLEANRDQLWAEAVHAFRAGEKWFLNDEEYALAKQEVELFTTFSPTAERIHSWYQSMPTKDRPSRLTCLEVAQAAFFATGITYNKSLQASIGNAFKQLGFIRNVTFKLGFRHVEYTVPDAIRLGLNSTTSTGVPLVVVASESDANVE